MRIGIVGMGVVGKHMARDLSYTKNTVYQYDKVTVFDGKQDINSCDAAFVCVSTPMAHNGEANLEAIHDVFSWLDVPISIIRSTVPPRTTQSLVAKYNRSIVFVPEFIGEGINAPYVNMTQPPFLIIGGDSLAQQQAYNVFTQIYNSECEFIFVDAVTAEVAKYAENYFLALKVSWANELSDICAQVGANFPQMMSAVTHDYRIGKSHTHVYAQKRGWDGRCLPKDLRALLHVVGTKNAPLLASLLCVNEIHKERNKK